MMFSSHTHCQSTVWASISFASLLQISRWTDESRLFKDMTQLWLLPQTAVIPPTSAPVSPPSTSAPAGSSVWATRSGKAASASSERECRLALSTRGRQSPAERSKAVR